MEEFFMQVFDRGDWVKAQMRQQVDSYAQSLAYSLLAAGRRPPAWLLPDPATGAPQELNGRPIVSELLFPRSQITTPATHSTLHPLAFPSTFLGKVGVPNDYIRPETNDSTVEISQHEVPYQEQTLVNQEFSETCAEANTFSRIQRSKSRQKSIEDRLREKDQSKNSKSSVMQSKIKRSRLATMRSNGTNESSSSQLCGNGGNNCQNTSSRLGQKNDCNSNQVISTEYLCGEDGDNEGEGIQADSFPSVALENQNLNYENHVTIPDNYSTGNMLRDPILDLSKLNTADSLCYPLPETHLLVEPKILQFDGVALGSLNPAGASETMNQHQKCDSEFAIPEITGMHSLTDGLSSSNSHEGLHSMVSSLVEKDKICTVEINSQERHDSMARLLLEKDTMHTAETSSLGGLHYMDSQQLEMDTLHIRKTGSFSDQSINGSSKFLEQQNLDTHAQPPLCNESSLPRTKVADTTSEAPALLGMLPENLLESSERSSHSQLDGPTSRYSQAMSATNPAQILPQTVNEGDVYDHKLASSRTESNGKYSNSGAIVDAFVSAENDSPKGQFLLANRPSLEFDRNCAIVDTPMACPALGTSHESLKIEPVLDSVNCHSEQSGDVPVNFSALTEAYDISVRNNKGEPAGLKVSSCTSSEMTTMQQTAERNNMTSADQHTGSLQHGGTEQQMYCFDNAAEIYAGSCTSESDKRTKSSQPSVRYLSHSSGSCKDITSIKSDGQNADSDPKMSIANKVQVNENSLSERRTANCQSDVVLCTSPGTRNTSSLNCQVGIEGQMETTANPSGESQPSAPYFLRSSGFSECMSLKPEGRSAASNQKRSGACDACTIGNSSPKRRSMVGLLDDVGCNSPGMKALSFSHCCDGSSWSGTIARVSQNSQSYSLDNNLDIVTASLPRCSDTLPNSDHCRKEGTPFFNDQDQDVATLAVKHQVLGLQMDNNVSGSGIFDPDNHRGIGSPTTIPSYALDRQFQQTYTWDASAQEKASYGSSFEFDEKATDDDPKVHLVIDAAIPWQKDDDFAHFDETVPEFESFSVPLQSNSPTIEERAFEAFCDSRKLVSLSSNLSMKYKIDTLSDVYQSLADRFKKLMNHSSLCVDDREQYNAGYDMDKLRISGTCGLELDDSFLMSDVLTSGSSNSLSGKENSEIPLTPSVEKYSQKKISGRTGSGSSEHMGSIPEFACFRIDEDSSTMEENKDQDRLPGSADGNYLNQWPTERKALQDITSYQSTGKSASLSARSMNVGKADLTTTEAYSTELDHHSNLRNDHASKKPKENYAPSVKREGNKSHSLHEKLCRTEMLINKKEKQRNGANLEEGCKPSNIVANMTSFIPLVKQKQQSTTACVKKDVRVKALEAAEAAKRLEEKKQNERETRKAAAKLERERLKQEKELRQRQEEQKKKRDTDVATRKRQREDEEKEKKDRKRKCIEEAQKQQKQPVERMRPTNNEKYAHRKDSDDKDQGKNAFVGVKSKLKSDERKESVLTYNKVENNNVKGVAVDDERPASSGLQVQENVPKNFEKSYEMSPYKDSDEDDDDDAEHEEELRRKRKLIPSWARKGNLDKILLSNRTLDPREIFARKCSFNLSDVLCPHIPQRRLL